MTGTLTVEAGERGIVRLFAVDLPPDAARAFAADPAAVARALGAPDLDASRIEVFPVARIAALGLPAFLAEGHGISPAALAPDAAALGALDGHVALVAAGAFGPEARILAVAPPLRLVGQWREDAAPVTFGTLPAEGARGALGEGAAAPSPPGSRRGMQRIVTLLVLVLAVLGFIILNGGQ